jgi:predicted thioredoxin/glutaredoxin
MLSRVALSKLKSSYFRSKFWSLFYTLIIEPIRSADKLNNRIKHIKTCLLTAFVKGEFWESSEILKHNSLVIRVINDWLTWLRQRGTVSIENLKANKPLNGLVRRVCGVYNYVLCKACNIQASDLPSGIKVSF